MLGGTDTNNTLGYFDRSTGTKPGRKKDDVRTMGSLLKVGHAFEGRTVLHKENNQKHNTSYQLPSNNHIPSLTIEQSAENNHQRH